MTTIREYLEAIRDDKNATLVSIARAMDALRLMDESETAWRKDGPTYRLVEDKIEVPA